MIYRIIKTDGYLFAIDKNEEYEIPPINKMLAHLPLGESPVIEGLDLLPDLDQDEYSKESLSLGEKPVGFDCEMIWVYPSGGQVLYSDFEKLAPRVNYSVDEMGRRTLIGKWFFL